MRFRFNFKMLAVASAAVVACSRPALAAENMSAYLPGATTGVPVGALPPPGFYASDDVYYAWGNSLRNGSGGGVPLKVQNFVNAPMLLWVSDWHLLGAQYGMNVMQLYAEHDVDKTAIGGKSTHSAGIFNTIVSPVILSWNLGHGLFTSAGLAAYMPDGHHEYTDGAAAQTSYANDYWTAEPNFAISYLKNGWDFTLNNVFDFNRTDPTTDYHSGTAYYLDATAAKTIGRWTVGLIGNYSRQFTDDYQYGEVVGDGNRFEHVLLGPLLSYDFGRAKVSLRYLQNIKTRNDVDVSFVHVSVSIPL